MRQHSHMPRINLTADQWELYQMPGRSAAARALNAAATAAIPIALTAYQRLRSPDLALDHAIETRLMPVALRYARFGAADSEPPEHARSAIRRYLGWD
jgi:hypothetical protein